MALIKINCRYFHFFPWFGVCFSSMVTAESSILSNDLTRLCRGWFVLSSGYNMHSRLFLLYQFLVWFWASARKLQSPFFPESVCLPVFGCFSLPLALFFGKLCIWSSQFDRLWIDCWGFSNISTFILQKPCSSLQCMRKFCSFCVWQHRLCHLSLFAVMLIVLLLVKRYCSGKIPAFQLWGLCKWHLWKIAWILLIQCVGRCQVSLFHQAFICEILLFGDFFPPV